LSANGPSEELRKIQVTGGSTYTVSLPKGWVEQVGLKKGSIVSIAQMDDLSLQVQPKGAEAPNSPRRAIITVTNEEAPEAIVRRVVSSYLLGYNIIQLRTPKKRMGSAHRYAVKDFTRKKLVGTEILSDLPRELTLQVLLSYSELSVKDALRRMSIIAASMHRDSIASLAVDDSQLSKEVISMDDEVDRFSFYIIRLLKVAVSDSHRLRESGLKSPRECLGYRLITKSVERMADHAVNIAQNRLALTLTTINEEILDELRGLSESALDVYESAVVSLFGEDNAAANSVLERAERIRGKEAEVLHKIIKNAAPEDVPSLRLIVESILRTAEYGTDIAEIVLNMTVQDAITEA
jgi:phosphate uptake regulator